MVSDKKFFLHIFSIKANEKTLDLGPGRIHKAQGYNSNKNMVEVD